MESGARDRRIAFSIALLIVGIVFSCAAFASGNFMLNVPAVSLWLASTCLSVSTLPRV